MPKYLTINDARAACEDGTIVYAISSFGIRPEVCYAVFGGQPITLSTVKSINFRALLDNYVGTEDDFPRFVMKTIFRNMRMLVTTRDSEGMLIIPELAADYVNGLLIGRVPNFGSRYLMSVIPHTPNTHLARPEWLIGDPIKATLIGFVNQAFSGDYEVEELFESVGTRKDDHVSSRANKPETVNALFDYIEQSSGASGDLKQQLVHTLRAKRDRRVAEIPDWF